MRNSGLPKWAVVLLVMVGLVVLGPPALVMLAVLIGVSFGLLALGLKFAVIGLAIFAAYALLKALFGREQRPRVMPVSRGSEIEYSHAESLARDQAEKRALDEELARVMAQTSV